MMHPYQPRPIRFLERYSCGDWTIKIYSISAKNALIASEFRTGAKAQLSEWLKNATNYDLPTYNIATLILHEGREGNFVLIQWWIDENMLQNHVYFSTRQQPTEFTLYSDKGIQMCVWELAVIWFERNAWVEHVLKKHRQPDFEAYLNEVLNEDI